MWVNASNRPNEDRVYECVRRFPDGSHCVERLKWTGSDWITNDEHGYRRTDVARYWADYPDPEGWQDFHAGRGREIWQRKTYYYCNPEKNPECLRRNCKYTTRDGDCDTTTRETCALRSPGGLPLVACVIVRKKGGEA